MPVTNRHIVMLSGSATKGTSIRSDDTGTHVNTDSIRSRWSGTSERRVK